MDTGCVSFGDSWWQFTAIFYNEYTQLQSKMHIQWYLSIGCYCYQRWCQIPISSNTKFPTPKTPHILAVCKHEVAVINFSPLSSPICNRYDMMWCDYVLTWCFAAPWHLVAVCDVCGGSSCPAYSPDALLYNLFFWHFCFLQTLTRIEKW